MPEHHSKPAATKEKPRQAIAPEVIPKVVLSGEDRATCLVDVGDTLPAANLPDLNGKMHTLESLYGPKLTVVCFWTMGTHRDQLVADEALSDLAQEVAASFGPKGVAVVAIDVGDPADAVAKELSQTGATFPCLRDPNGGYFGKIAKGDQMPRTFLLDAGGRILWFDIEYSRPSRRELLRCIQVAFGKL
jgi:peroxiredoxin